MLRVPLLCLAIFAAAWLEFEVFPGHGYLEGDTQIYLPMLERMDAPGLLSRDLVAVNQSLSLTAYDEITLFLHETLRQPFRRALLAQQFLCRLAALLGLFLLARAAGLSQLFALLVAVLVNLGAHLAGPAIWLTDREPLAGPFSFAWTLLAMGLLAQEIPLLAAVSGGLAFLYDPVLASPFWAVLLVAFCIDKGMRRLARPTWPVFLIFTLLLANLAQLQPGTPAEPILTRVSDQLAAFQRLYGRHLYVSAWQAGDTFQILALSALGGWAAARCWSELTRTLRWILLGTGACGLLSIPLSFVLLDEARFSWVARLQPTRTLLFSAAAAALFFGLAGVRSVLRKSQMEALAWFLLLLMLPIGRGVSHPPRLPATADLAQWADSSTWGSSVFLFPDAGRASYPSVFRAQSRHAIWVDWASARGVAYSETAAAKWQQRWRETMDGGFSLPKLEGMLPLPIDYYALLKANELAGVRVAFANSDLVVYEAEDLRNAPKPLRLKR